MLTWEIHQSARPRWAACWALNNIAGLITSSDHSAVRTCHPKLDPAREPAGCSDDFGLRANERQPRAAVGRGGGGGMWVERVMGQKWQTDRATPMWQNARLRRTLTSIIFLRIGKFVYRDFDLFCKWTWGDWGRPHGLNVVNSQFCPQLKFKVEINKFKKNLSMFKGLMRVFLHP